jgi:hypothetical protein
MTGFESKRQAALDKLIKLTDEMGLYDKPAQEPVAFYNPQQGGFYWAKPTTIHAPQAVDIVPLALYANPIQRPWVGLTEDQFLEAARLAEDGNYLVAFQRIQQWLKEKNI